MLTTTAGQLAVNEALPEDLRDHSRRLNKKSIQELLQQVAEKHPDKFRDVAHQLSNVGRHVSQATGGFSFGLKHLEPAAAALQARAEIRAKQHQIYSDPRTTDDQKEKALISHLAGLSSGLDESIFQESMRDNNPLAHQVVGAGRGNKTSLKSLRGMDLLYVDHKDRPIPIPVMHSYSEGLRPAEYYAGTFGARKGVIDTKMATQDAGYFSKQLIQAAHRLLVTKNDHEDKVSREHIGMPVSTTDPDNEGSLLARPIAGYPRDTQLTPKVISHIVSKGHQRMLVRSPITGGPPNGGVYGKDVGVRERGGVSPTGDFVGIAAAQALAEPLSQAQLSSKHSGGVVGGTSKGVSGFKLVDQLVQVPKTFKGGATHAQVDGKVSHIDPAPQGGSYINIAGKKHYVAQGYGVHVKPGDEVEAGDILSEGTPNPREIVTHKGIGEGRRFLTEALRSAYKESSMPHHRRNLELVARGLVDHVRMNEEYGDHIPGDVVPYSRLEHYWKPREGHEIREPRHAKGMYLEKPALHYTIGTQVKPSVQKNLNDFGIGSVVVHKDPPPFEPEMVRGAENVSKDPDWQTRMMGSHLEKGLLRGVYRGDVSDETGSSYVPSLMRGEQFGKAGPIKTFPGPKYVSAPAGLT